MLNGARLFGLAGHLLAPLVLIVEAPRVLHRDRDVRAESLQKAKLRGREGVEFAMRGGEHSDQVAFDLQRDGDFRARILLAGHVIRVASYVGGIVHLAGGGDVANHSLGADFQPVAFVVNAASANASEHKFSLLGMMKI